MDPTAVLRVVYPITGPEGSLARESASSPPQPPRLLDRVRAAIRAHHYSRRTEKAYVAWIRRFILFRRKRHPRRDGRRRGHTVPECSRRRQERRRVYAEPGLECHPVPLSRRAR